MGNRMEFGCDGNERWANLPEAKQASTKTKTKAKKAATMDVAERLRQALLKRLAA
jgi:hypothetical protein